MKFYRRARAIITESKADIQAFIDKFGQDTYDLFVKSKDRLKNNKLSTDIVWHTKNTSPEEMDNMLSTLQQKMGNKDMSNVDFSKEQIPGKYKYLGKHNGYDVYQPLDYISSMALGVNTGWCTTGRYGHYGDPNFAPSDVDAKRHFDDYTGRGIELYYFLNPKTHYGEFAVAKYPSEMVVGRQVVCPAGIGYLDTTNFEIFNARDDLDYGKVGDISKDLIDKLGLILELEDVVSPDDVIKINPQDVNEITLLSTGECNPIPDSILPYSNSWWLRTPGLNSFNAAVVFNGGSVSPYGYSVDYNGNAVRPALIIQNLKSSNLIKYKSTVKVFDRYWIYTHHDLFLLMGEPLAKMAFNADKSKGNDYEKSDVKKWLDNWLAEQKAKYSKNESLLKESVEETDSEGNPLSPEQIEFFKNSKIRDRQGRLLVCYHGSNAKFDRFDKSKATDGSFGRGFYFTTNEYEASEYGSNIAKVYLNIANLYYIGDEDCDERLLAYLEQQGVEFDMGDAKREAGNNIIEYFDFEQFVTDAIIELGYDGIQPFSDMFIAFEPNQIKSITNKTPTNSDNINEESLNKGLKEDMELNFDRALLDKWIDDLNANGAKHHQTFSYTEGGKYIKVSYTYGGRYDTAVFAFVDADGNIYKPAGWKTPAKGVRARIDQNPPMDEKDLYSARYRAAVYGESVREEILTEKPSPAGYEPTKKGIAYKVFKVKNGKLYPPMVANAGGADTPIGVWLDAEEGEFAGLSKTGRPQVKSTGSGNLSYRPGWHLGDIPRAKQFDRLNKETGEYEFPKDFVWAECEYAMDVDYQPESDARGYERTKVDKDGNVIVTKSDKYQHSLAGLPKLPTNGYYKYRTNPNPDTVPWVITGQMKVNRLLSDAEVNAILEKNGIEPIHRQGGDKTLAELGLKEGLGEDWYFHDDDSYFSHEQLLDFASDLEDAIQDRHGMMFTVTSVWFEKDNSLVADVQIGKYGDDMLVSQKVDMRRVKTERDLRKYIPALVDQVTKQAVDDDY